MRENVEKLIDLVNRHVALRFFISGGTSAFVDLLVLAILNSILEINYIVSAVVAFICAFGVSFTLHKFWTFRSHGESTHKQAFMYLGTSLFGLFLNTMLMILFVDHLFSGLPFKHKIIVLLSQVVVGLIVAVFSFFLSHTFVFKYKPENNLQ